MNILVVNEMRKITHSLRPEIQSYLHWAAAGHKVTIFSPESEYRPQLEAAGINVLCSPQQRKLSWPAIKALRAELTRQHYDIIYAINSKTIPTAAFAAIGFPAKLICYRGTTNGLYRSDPTAYLTLHHPRVDGVACVSGAVTDYVKSKLWRNHDRVVTIYKGHELSWYNETPADLSEFGIPSDAFVVIAAAQFRPSKGLSVLLEASNAWAELDNLHLLLVGNGIDEATYGDAIRQSAIADRIHQTGYRNDAPRLIAASHLLVQASIRGEGLPRSIVEGLAYGVPAISTTTGGAKEILVEGETGFIVPTHDAKAIADRVTTLYQQPEKLQAMAANCRATIQNQLSSANTAQQFIDFFQSLL